MMTTILPYNIYKLKDDKNTSYIEEIEKDDWSIRFEDLVSQNYKLCYYLLITIYVVLLACIVLISISTLYIHHKTMRKRKSLDKLYPKNNVTLENQYFIQSTFNPYGGGIQWINLIDKSALKLGSQIGKVVFRFCAALTVILLIQPCAYTNSKIEILLLIDPELFHPHEIYTKKKIFNFYEKNREQNNLISIGQNRDKENLGKTREKLEKSRENLEKSRENLGKSRANLGKSRQNL